MSAVAGGVAELHLRMLPGSLDHIVLVTEAVGKDDVAAFIDQVHGGLEAHLILINAGLEDVVGIGEAQIGNGLLGGVDEVQVVGGGLIVQGDEAHLHSSGLLVVVRDVGVVGLLLLTAGNQAQCHDQSDDQCKELFHSFFLL